MCESESESGGVHPTSGHGMLQKEKWNNERQKERKKESIHRSLFPSLPSSH